MFYQDLNLALPGVSNYIIGYSYTLAVSELFKLPIVMFIVEIEDHFSSNEYIQLDADLYYDVRHHTLLSKDVIYYGIFKDINIFHGDNFKTKQTLFTSSEFKKYNAKHIMGNVTQTDVNDSIEKIKSNKKYINTFINLKREDGTYLISADVRDIVNIELTGNHRL